MFKKMILLGGLCSPFLLQAQISNRDTSNLEEIIISENRLQIPFSKTSRNIQVVTKEDIKSIAAKSIYEVLSFVAGVDIRQRGAFGTQTDISIDGGSFEQTLVLLNGVKISDAQTGHHAMNIPVPLEAVERIEILRGPAARVYGVNALTGAVNIITKNSSNNSFSVQTQIGSAFKKKEDGDGNGYYGGASLQVVANVGTEKLKNLITISQDLNNGQRYNTAAKNTKAFYQSSYSVDTSNSITWFAGHMQNNFGANAFYAAPYDIEAQEIVGTTILSLGSNHKFGNRFELKPRVSYRYNEDDFRLNRKNLATGRSLHNTDAFSLELNSVYHTTVGDVGVGVESRSEKIQSTNIGDHHRYNHGAYVEYRTEAIKNILLNAGTYINYNTAYGWKAFPSLDVAYLFHPAWKLAFNVGSSQRIPSYTDLYIDQSINKGNPDLITENAWQYEGSLQYHAGDFRVQVGAFQRDIVEFIDWVQDLNLKYYKPYNFDSNKVFGLHLIVSQQIAFTSNNVFSYQASYNYLQPENMNYAEGVKSKYTLENLKHQAILRLAYRHGNWSVATGNRYVERKLNKGYFIADARFAFQREGFRVFTDLNNIFDKTYSEIGAVPLPGRWLSVGFNYQFDIR